MCPTSSVSGLQATGPTSSTPSFQAGCGTTSPSAYVSAPTIPYRLTGASYVSTTPSFEPNIRPKVFYVLLNEVCVWGGTQTTTGVQLAASHELFNMQQGTKRGGEGVLVNEDPLPKPVQTYLPVSALGPSVGSWGTPSFHLMFHLHPISCCAIPGVWHGEGMTHTLTDHPHCKCACHS